LIRPTRRTAWVILAVAASAAIAGYTYAQQQSEPRGKTSYMPVDIVEPFAAIMARMVAAKPQIVVANKIDKNHIHGYVDESKYKSADLEAMAGSAGNGGAAVPNSLTGAPAPQPRQRLEPPKN